MSTRKELKDRAKGFLRGNYWKAFIVCLISITIFGTSDSNMVLRFKENEAFKIQSPDDYAYSIGLLYQDGNITDWDGNIIRKIEPENKGKYFIVQNNPLIDIFSYEPTVLGFIKLQTYLTVAIIILIIGITIGSVMEVGKNRFFLRGFESEARVGDLFSTFNKEEYLPIFKTQFMKGLYIILWTLLLIVPGIIKTFEYMMVPYILAEDPHISTKEALELSSEMTDGHKWDIFVLGLSFILWDILGLISLGIGGVFVRPYVEATFAKLYVDLLENIKSPDRELEEEIIDSRY
nr:DUF975 family protein [Tissierella sp.]